MGEALMPFYGQADTHNATWYPRDGTSSRANLRVKTSPTSWSSCVARRIWRDKFNLFIRRDWIAYVFSSMSCATQIDIAISNISRIARDRERDCLEKYRGFLKKKISFTFARDYNARSRVVSRYCAFRHSNRFCNPFRNLWRWLLRYWRRRRLQQEIFATPFLQYQ